MVSEIFPDYRLVSLTMETGWNAPRKSLLLVHPDGIGSKVTNEELHIAFDPTPDYSGIAKAASCHKAWASQISFASEVSKSLRAAVNAVKSGSSAIIDARLGYSIP